MTTKPSLRALILEILANNYGDDTLAELNSTNIKATTQIISILIKEIRGKMPDKRTVEIKGIVKGMGLMAEYQTNELTAQVNAGYNQALNSVLSILDEMDSK